MKISEIFEQWDVDSKIDITQLHLESIKIPQLHNKYYKLYIQEKKSEKVWLQEYNKLKFSKEEFYTQGPNEETNKLGWKLPPKGKILKADVEKYLTVDEDLIKISNKLFLLKEKLELLKSILDTLSKRSFHLNAAIEFMKFQNNV